MDLLTDLSKVMACPPDPTYNSTVNPYKKAIEYDQNQFKKCQLKIEIFIETFF